MRKVILAENAGFCFGVQLAVEKSLDIQKQFNKKIYTLGPLIHNNDVVNYLEENSIESIDYNNIDSLSEDSVIVIRSHGVSEEVLDKLSKKGFEVINATCPFVTNIQKKVKKYSAEGYNIVILGDEKHPEVVGINGWCKDSALITKDGEFTSSLPSKVCAVSQTTEKESNWKKTIENLSFNTKELLAFNTICSATEVRQKSANELSKEVDAMIVIGGKNSSNTTKLYQISRENCKNTIHIENAKELPMEYINNANFKKIGITAGASTPDWIIREVVDIMQNETNMNEQLELMNEMDRSFRTGDEIEGEILSKTRDGIMVSLVGYKTDGYIPYKELTVLEDPIVYAEKLNVGENIKAKVIKLKDAQNNLVVLSRLEYEKTVALEELENMFKNEEIFSLKISEIKEKGLVGYYKGIRVFVPSSQIDLRFIKDKSKFLNQELEVKIIEFKIATPLRIVASRRIIQESAQKEIEDKAWSNFNVGDVVKGEVKRFTDFGAFIEINGVDGLVHLSQISWNHVKKAQDYLKAGDIIDVKIIEMDRESKKLSLSIKELTPEPWKDIEERYPEGSIVLGKAVRINDFGVFVELEDGVDGLVHISKISHDRINHPNEVVKINDEIKAKILSVNGEEKKISLSMKDV